jgi:hypothetical protein
MLINAEYRRFHLKLETRLSRSTGKGGYGLNRNKCWMAEIVRLQTTLENQNVDWASLGHAYGLHFQMLVEVSQPG